MDKTLIANRAAEWWTGQFIKEVLPEQKDAFKMELTKAIKSKITPAGTLRMGTDYQARGILADAAKKAGIGVNNFPQNLTMCITAKGIRVSTDYGSPFKEI